MGLIEGDSCLLQTLQLVLHVIAISICVFTAFARCTQLRGYLPDRIARAKICWQTEKVSPIPLTAVSLKPHPFPNAKTKTLTNNWRFPLISCLLSVWMDCMVLVMVVLAFRTTDVQSPVATGLDMLLANSCRIAGKNSRWFLVKD